jgi:hypothetical protein
MLNLFSFAGPGFTILCVFVAKKGDFLDGRTDTRYKMTIFYLCVRKFYVDTYKLPPGTLFVSLSKIHQLRNQSFTRGTP